MMQPPPPPPPSNNPEKGGGETPKHSRNALAMDLCIEHLRASGRCTEKAIDSLFCRIKWGRRTGKLKVIHLSNAFGAFFGFLFFALMRDCFLPFPRSLH